MLVDSHCHLDFEDYDGELDAVLARARERGVGTMLTISTHLERFPGVLAIAEAHDDVFCTVGVHPHEAQHHGHVTADMLVELADHPKVVGIGESGLDYYYEHSPREAQQACFRAHIEASRRTGLPLVVHTREADEDTGRILAEETGKGAFPGLIHCFSSSRQLAENMVEIGLSISISGIVSFNKAEDLRTTVSGLPLESLLVETDAPFLAPVPNRGKRNEPAFVADTAACVAEVRGLSLENLAEATTDNFFQLFTKANRPGQAATSAA